MKRYGFVALILFISSFLYASEQSEYESQLQKLFATYRIISGLYVDEVNHEKIVERSIISMLEELDPHSAYISAADVKKMNEPLVGNFDGIGIQFNVLDDTLLVVSPIPGGPSEKVGIRAGDRIVKVDTTIIAGVNCDRTKMMEYLRGEKGTKVVVEVKRKNVSEKLYFTVTRDKIPIYSVGATYMIGECIGYIKIDRFAATTYREFLEALFELKGQGMKKLIVDLQGNGGGYMQPAIEIADQFLSNDKLVVYTEGRKSPKQSYKARGGGFFEKGDLVILIDESSASASEILAGAVQDWDRGTIVGRRSFGKGLVQQPKKLPDGAEIRITTARYHTPSGRCIQKPYSEGHKDEYGKDLMERYEKGELVSFDSIDFPDSLKYKTLIAERTVYGGGGIVPDIFISLDTTTYSDFHLKVVASGLLNDFMLNYMDDNRDFLTQKYNDFESFNEQYVVTESLFQEMVNDAASDSIVYDADEFEVSRQYLFLQMKALIARDLFEMNEYYHIMNQRNRSVQKAIELLENK